LVQYDLLSYLARLAEKNDEFLRLDPPHDSLDWAWSAEFMTAQRKERLRTRPNVEFIDRRISEPIMVSSTICPSATEFNEGAEQLGLAVRGAVGREVADSPFVINVTTSPPRREVLIESAFVSGINFRLYGHSLFPGEDRLSFVFLRCPEAAFINNRIVAVFHKTEYPGLINFDRLREANWYVTAPELHLRYYLETWTDFLFSWVKFFFIPDFMWWRYEQLSGYDQYRVEFENLQARWGARVATTAGFDLLLEDFIAEAGQWGKAPELTRSAQPRRKDPKA
jgi:hypothetical protein